MKTEINSKRRLLLVSTAGAALVLGNGGCQTHGMPERQLQFASFLQADAELARLSSAKELASDAVWSWTQTLQHCAQSIEFSMQGFPESKSSLFQNTLGAAAFGVFAWRGRMSHDLAEPIPGAGVLDEKLAAAQALARLRAAIHQFQAWSAPFKPHFAYGMLDKKEYELAHAMHLANHLSAFQVKA